MASFVAIPVPSAAAANAAPCPTQAVARLAPSWGAEGDERRGTRASRPEITTDTTVTRRGLAKLGRVELRTVASRRGARRAVLCAGGRIRASVPVPARPARFGAVAVNGSFVAWTVVAPGKPGVVAVARVRGGRLTDVRRSRRATGRGSDLDTGLFVTVADGTTAWISGTLPSQVGAVWRRGDTPVSFRQDSSASRFVPPISGPPYLPSSVTIVDDRHVLLGADQSLRTFGPPTPGQCPKLAFGQFKGLGGWRIASIGGTSRDLVRGFESVNRTVVCDPATAEYLRVSTSTATVSDYGTSYSGDSRWVRQGPWLITESTRDGVSGVSLLNTETGQRESASGRLTSGVPPTPAPPGVGSVDIRTGVVAKAGLSAWVSSSPSPIDPTLRDVWVSDALGTRVVGQALSQPLNFTEDAAGLRLVGDRLIWRTVDGERSVVVQPSSGSPYGTIDATD